MQPARPSSDVPNVKLTGCDVKIAAQQHVLVYIAGLVKKRTQSLQPVELEVELIRPQLAAVRDVCIDDPNAVDRRRDHAFWRFLIVVEKILLNVLDPVFRDDSDPVIG